MKIKKSVISGSILFMLLFSSVVTYAQPRFIPWFKAGPTFSNMVLGYTSDKYKALMFNGRNTGFHAGIVGLFPFSDKLGLQMEALFAQKGIKLETVEPLKFSSGSTFTYKSKQTASYIEIPLMFRYNLIGNFTEGGGFFLAAGPYLGFGIGGYLSEFGEENGVTTSNKAKIKMGNKINANYRSAEVGFAVSLGGFVAISETGRLIFEARLVNGGSNILNENYTGRSNAIINSLTIVNEAKNRSIQLSIGYIQSIIER